MPTGVLRGADLPHVLLMRLVADCRAAGRPPTTRLFTTCRPDAAAALVTTWLRDGLRRLGITPAVGTVYASHYLTSGGAIAANAAGVNRGAITALSATTKPTLAASDMSSLVIQSVFDRFLFAPPLPQKCRRAYSLCLAYAGPCPLL